MLRIKSADSLKNKTSELTNNKLANMIPFLKGTIPNSFHGVYELRTKGLTAGHMNINWLFAKPI